MQGRGIPSSVQTRCESQMGVSLNNHEMKQNYIDLFAERKWKAAFAAMPLNIPKAITVGSANDLNIVRVRASEFSRETDKSVSVSVDYDLKQAIVTVKKK